MECCWSDRARKNVITLGFECYRAILSTRNPMWIVLAFKPDFYEIVSSNISNCGQTRILFPKHSALGLVIYYEQPPVIRMKLISVHAHTTVRCLTLPLSPYIRYGAVRHTIYHVCLCLIVLPILTMGIWWVLLPGHIVNTLYLIPVSIRNNYYYYYYYHYLLYAGYLYIYSWDKQCP
jgi:hypothetical protein